MGKILVKTDSWSPFRNFNVAFKFRASKPKQ